MKRVSRINQENPELLDNEEILGVATEADRLQEFAIIAKTPEGETLIKTLLKDYILKAQHLQGMYKTATRDEMVSYLASMEASWDTATLLANADKLLKYLDAELEEALTS